MAVIAAGLAMVVAPGLALAQRPLGIDVSSYQGSGVNWTSVKGCGPGLRLGQGHGRHLDHRCGFHRQREQRQGGRRLHGRLSLLPTRN